MKTKFAIIFVALLALRVAIDSAGLGVASGIWNLAFLAWGVGLGVLLFNRVWFSFVLVAGAFFGLVMSDRAKFYFMDDHLRWSDMMNITRHFDSLSGLRQFATLMGQYAASLINWQSGLVVIVAVAAMGLVFWVEPKVFGSETRLGKPTVRLLTGAVVVVGTLMLAPPTARTVFHAAYSDRLTAENYKMAGQPMFFFASKEPSFSIPNGAALASTTPVESSETLTATPLSDGQTRPDIIIWVNESTFDLRDFDQVEIAADVPNTDLVLPQLSMFEPREQTVFHGQLDVGIFGGKSWNTVFALQAGAHVSWFSDDTYAASALSQRVDVTLFKKLKANGYDIEALYAQDGYLFDAAKSQFGYGADRFYGSDFIEPADAVLGRATDVETADALKKLMAVPSDKPRAYFIFTMANHGPYPSNQFVANDDIISRWGQLPDGILDYLERVSETNAVMEDLAATFKASETPTVFLHMGDHKPRIAQVAFGAQNKYQTYYQVHTNFPVEGHSTAVERDTDVIFLGKMLLDLAQIEPGPLFSANALFALDCEQQVNKCINDGNEPGTTYQTLAQQNLRY